MQNVGLNDNRIVIYQLCQSYRVIYPGLDRHMISVKARW
jgi:hypothetical protein